MDQQELERRKGSHEAKENGDEEKWVHDSSVDYKGRIPLRRSTGAWKASLLIITIEFCERITFFGIATNLISYVTKVIHQELKTAAKNVNNWGGVATVMPLVGGFLADAYTGRFAMILVASLIYFMGLSLLAMSQFVPNLRPCNSVICQNPRKIHEVVFFLGIYCLSLGTGGHKPCLQSFGADQFDDGHSEERKKKMSYFNWWNLALSCGLLLGVTVMVYVEDDVSWGAAYLILAIIMAFCIVILYLGRPLYRYRLPGGSPFTPMFQVLVAAVRKRKLPYPSNPDLFYEVPKTLKTHGRLLGLTNRLRFLDKAAIIEDKVQMATDEVNKNPWRLATVTRVEEMKLVLNLIPIWLTCIVFGINVSQPTTFFVKQAATLNRKIIHNFHIPPASVNSLTALAMILTTSIYEKILVPTCRRITGNERGISILKRIGIGMILAVIALSVAAMVETKRLRVSMQDMNNMLQESKTNTHLPMSVFWLAPQYLILGIADAFSLVGMQEYFYDQVPDSMRSMGIALYLSGHGFGHFLCSFVIILVDRFTEKDGKSWIGKDLNSSRLDNFYWLLTAINMLNLCVFVFLARRYIYKNVQQNLLVADCNEDDKQVELMP